MIDGLIELGLTSLQQYFSYIVSVSFSTESGVPGGYRRP